MFIKARHVRGLVSISVQYKELYEGYASLDTQFEQVPQMQV